MTRNKNVKHLLRNALPSASKQQVESAGDRAFQLLQADPDRVPTQPENLFEPSLPQRRGWQWARLVIAATIVAAVLVPTKIVQSAPAVFDDGSAKRLIRYGEVVRAGGDMSAMLSMTAGPRVEMRSESELTLERGEGGTTRILLKKGDVIVDAPAQPSRNLSVQTKDIVAFVGGAVSLVNAEEGGSRITAIGGEVLVQQGKTEKKLRSGEEVKSNPEMQSLSVRDALTWSRQAVLHLSMLQQQTALLLSQTIRSGLIPHTASGEVRDARTNEPLSKVRVALFSPQSVRAWNTPVIQPVAPAAFASSDSEGRFTISAPPGRYRIVPQLEGYTHFDPSQQDGGFLAPDVWIRIPESGSVESIALRMAREGVVTGEVLDANGRPPTGRRSVSLVRPAFNERGERRLVGVPGGSAYLDDRGRYRIFGVPPGDYYLFAAGGGSPVGREARTLYPGTSDERLAVTVKVVTGEETRLNAVRLQEASALGEVHLAIKDPIWQRGRSNRIDLAGGAFRGGPDLSVTPYIMREVKAGHHTMILNGTFAGQMFYSWVAVDVQPHGRVEQEVTLSRGLQIEGLVRMEGSDILESDFPCRLSLTSPAGFEHWLTPCTGGRSVVSGVYRIELHPSVHPDLYIVSAQARGKDILAGGLRLEADAEVEIVLSRSGGSVVGKVRNTEGNGVPSAVVALVPDEPFRAAGVLYRSAISGRDGEFELRGIRPGNYRLFAWPHFEGAAYRNAEFLKPFEGDGRPVSIERDSKAAVDLRLLGQARE